MTAPHIPKAEPSLLELTLIAWHALLANPSNGHHSHSLPEQAVDHARWMQRALREEGIR